MPLNLALLWLPVLLKPLFIVFLPSSLPCCVDLTVAVDGNKVITLPDNTVQVFASTWPKLEHPHYRWEKVFGPNKGALSGINQDSVTLSGVSRVEQGEGERRCHVCEVVSVFGGRAC